MKKTKYLLVLLISILAINLINLNVYASASGSLSVSTTSVSVGSTFTVTANVTSAAAWNVHVTATGPVSGCSINQADATADAQDANKSFNATCTATAEGTITVTLSGDATSASDGKAITISGTKTVTVTPKVLSSDSTLKSLSVSGQTLSPAFSSGTKAYNVSVPATTTSVTISATANNSKATVSGDKGTFSLNTSPKTATIKVTAEDGSSTNYTITFTKKDPEPDNPPATTASSLLKSLYIEGYTINPTFTSQTTSYSINVGNKVTGLTVTATPVDSSATVSVSGNKNWVVGNNTITITVTATDGSTTTYTVNAKRASATTTTTTTKSSNKNITIAIGSAHTISPNFSNDVDEYVLVVPNGVSDLQLTATPADKNAKAVVTGGKDLKVDEENTVTILVTAQDGSTRTITMKVTRSKMESKAKVIDIRINNNFTMIPSFNSEVQKYTVDVDYKTDKLDLVVQVPDGVTYEIEGNNSFVTGQNIVLVKAKDANGFERIYQIMVNKAAKATATGDSKLFWLELFIFLLLLLIIIVLLILLLRRRRSRDVTVIKEDSSSPDKENTPVNIDFKPEFNFNTKKNTDDDVALNKYKGVR